MGEAGAVHRIPVWVGRDPKVRLVPPPCLGQVQLLLPGRDNSQLSLQGCAHGNAPPNSTACQDTALLPQNRRPEAPQTSAGGGVGGKEWIWGHSPSSLPGLSQFSSFSARFGIPKN